MEPMTNDSQERAVKDVLTGALAAALKLAPHELDPELSFLEMGASSLVLVDTFRQLHERFNVRVSVRRVFEEFGTIELLSRHVAELMRRAPAAAAMQEAGAMAELSLTSTQRQIGWLARYSEGASAAYNETLAVEISGALEIPRLASAVSRVAERHEALRLRVSVDDQRVAIGRSPAALELVDLTASPDARAATRAWLEADAAKSFDLSERVFRATLLRLSATELLLVLTAHAIAVDRRSLGVVLGEIGAIYADPSAELPPPSSFADFARALDHSEKTDAHAEAEAFWLSRFKGGVPAFELPSDRPRPPTKSYRGARMMTVLKPEVVSALRALGKKHGATLAMIMNAAFQVLVRRISGQPEVVVGGFGQVDAPGGAALVANKTNPIALHTRVESGRSFLDLLEELRGVLLSAFDAQSYPFARLVDRLQLERDQSRSAVFVTALSVEAPIEAPRLPGLKASIVATPLAYTRYDFELEIVESQDAVAIAAAYASDLYDPRTIKRWVGYFKTLLGALPEHHSRPIGDLPLLSPTDERELLESFGSAPRTYPTGQTMVELFEAQVDRTPDAVAVIHGLDRLSYRALDARANQVANALIARGVGPGAFVGVLMERTAEIVVAILGILKSGAAYVPLDPAYPKERIDLVREDAALELILETTRDLEGSSLRPARRAAPTDLGYVIYTSGSTGRPKGVAIEHRAAVNFLYWAQETFPPEELARTLFSTSICFDLSVFEIFAPLTTGAALIVAADALELPSLPARDEVTLINTVPSAIRQLIRSGGVPKSARCINLAGEALYNELTSEIYEQTPVGRVLNLYGPSESTTYSTFDVVRRGTEEAVTIGKAVANTTLLVLDERLKLAPIGAVGELYIGGEGLARGYLLRPELTAERFIPAPYGAGRAYKTGDLVRWLPDGRLLYVGRSDHQVKVRGYRIELGEIEVALRSHPGVLDAAAVVREDASKDRRIIAYVVGRTELSVSELRAFLEQHIPKYMIPATFVQLPALPLLPNGKVDKKALPVPSDENQAKKANRWVAPRNPTEEVLAEIWADVLGTRKVGVHDDFFELGGDSLRLTPLMVQVWKTFGTRLSMKQFFAAPTVAGVAETVGKMRMGLAPREAKNDTEFDQASPAVQRRFDFLYAEAELDPALTWSGAPYVFEKPKTILLTGGTGFVGAHLLAELIEQTDARILCLVRAPDIEKGKERLARSLEYFNLQKPGQLERIDAVLGDLTEPSLGLAPALFAKLAGSVDAIIHNGAAVNFIYPYEALKSANVDATKEVIRLAFSERLKPVHFISTVAVLPMGAHHRFNEEGSLDHRLQLNMAYDETKWVAEKMLTHAGARGLPYAVYRPGEVSGHSATGMCVPQHFIYAVMAGSMQLGSMPYSASLIDITPVDYVAKAIVHLSGRADALGRTFHLTNPEPKHTSWLMDWLHLSGYGFDLAKLDEWRSKLLGDPGFTKNALYPYATVLDDLHDVHLNFPEFDSRQTQAMLEGTGIRCPKIDDALLSTYLSFFVDVGFMIPPQRPRARSEA